jgi:hypothetical protein
MASEEIRARLGLSTTKFGQGLKKAELQAKTFGKKFQSALGFFGLTVTLTLLAGKIDRFTSKILESSRRFGIGTDFIQAFNFHATEANIRTETATMALQRFTRRIGEAARGEGVLSRVVAENNIQLRNQDGSMRSTEAILVDYARTVRDASSQQERLRLSFAAFDSEGAALVEIMNALAEGQDDFISRAREMNAIIEQDSIRSIDRLTTQFRLLGLQGIAWASNKIGEFINGIQDLGALAGAYAGQEGGLMDLIAPFVPGAEAFRNAGGAQGREDRANRAAEIMAEMRAQRDAQVNAAIAAREQAALQDKLISALQKELSIREKIMMTVRDRTRMKLEEFANLDVRANIQRAFAVNRERRDRANQMDARAAGLRRQGNDQDAHRFEVMAEQLRNTIVNPLAGAQAQMLQRQQAQRVLGLEAEARRMAELGNPGLADIYTQRALDLRGQIADLQSGDQDPLARLNEQQAEANRVLEDIRAQLPEAVQTGVSNAIRSLNEE